MSTPRWAPDVRSIVVAVLISVLAAETGGANSEKQSLRAEWLARQEQVHSVSFAWTLKEFIAAGTHSRSLSSREEAAGFVIPASDLRLERSDRLLLSGKKLHYSYDGNFFDIGKGKVRPKRYISVADVKTSRTSIGSLTRNRRIFRD